MIGCHWQPMMTALLPQSLSGGALQEDLCSRLSVPLTRSLSTADVTCLPFGYGALTSCGKTKVSDINVTYEPCCHNNHPPHKALFMSRSVASAARCAVRCSSARPPCPPTSSSTRTPDPTPASTAANASTRSQT